MSPPLIDHVVVKMENDSLKRKRKERTLRRDPLMSWIDSLCHSDDVTDVDVRLNVLSQLGSLEQTKTYYLDMEEGRNLESLYNALKKDKV